MASNLIDRMNYYREFKEWYLIIREDFNFNYQKDRDSRDYLSIVLKNKTDAWNLEQILSSFKDVMQQKNLIVIYGCGPSLETTVKALLNIEGKNFFNNCLNLAADGASVLLREKGIHIDGIFSDLDGITKKEFEVTNFMIIHTHGDNMDKLKYFTLELLKFKKIIGTTQVEPLENIINPGGFTDGDRILYFLRPLLKPFHKIILIGMDFKKVVGKYSKLDMVKDQEGSPMKQKKLQYAVELIKWLKNKIINEIYFVNSEFITKEFKYASINEFLEFSK